MLILSVESIFETWSEIEKGRFAGARIVLNNYELKTINFIRHHPDRRVPVLAYLKVRVSRINRENKWLSTIGEF